MYKAVDGLAYFGQTLATDKQPSRFNGPEFYKGLQDKIRSFGIEAKFIITHFGQNDIPLLERALVENPDLFAGGLLQINPNFGLKDKIGYVSPYEVECIICRNKNKKRKIVGLKLNTAVTRSKVDGFPVLPYYGLAEEYDMPVMFHCGTNGQQFTHPDYFRRIADTFPDLVQIYQHYGGLRTDYMVEYIKLVSELEGKGIMATAGLSGELRRIDLTTIPATETNDEYPDKFTQFFLDTIGGIQDRVILSMDSGWLRSTLHPIDGASEEIIKKVCWENPINVFGLDFLTKTL
ncbi:MAG: amidohydrolase family protein [Nanoarchaeota archaeon]